MRTSRLMRVVLFSLSLLLALGFGFVKAEPAQAQEGAGIPLVKFEGVITAIDDATDVWTIDEQSVTVTDTTIIVETEGPAEVGARVVVVAKRVAEGEYEAILIRVKPAQATRIVYLAGKVQTLSDDLLVLHNGKEVQITDGTQVEGELSVDDYVLIKAAFDGDSYVALKIQVVEPVMQRVVEFDGIVTEIGDEMWVIGDQEVGIDEHTVILGNIVVGDRVKVRAYKTESGLVALLIKKAGASWWPKMARFRGPIVELPETSLIGDWVVNDGVEDRTVKVTHFTRIRGEPAVGAIAQVTAWCFPNGAECVAMEIKIEGQEADEVTVNGVIAKLPDQGMWGTWLIDEGAQTEVQVSSVREVLVLPGSRIQGMPKVGDSVKVTGILQTDGIIVAKDLVIEIEEPIEGIHLIGKVTKLGAGYIEIMPAVPLGTIKITYTPDVVNGTLAIDACVAILAQKTGENEYAAIQITVVECPGPKSADASVARTVE